MDTFIEIHGLEDWIDDIRQVIVDFSEDSDLSNLGGYISLADAAVLQAIQNGMRLYEGQGIICENNFCDSAQTAAEGWATFFRGFKEGGVSKNQLIADRLDAEQGGVNYAVALTDASGLYDQASNEEKLKIDLFIGGANTYCAYGAWRRSIPWPCWFSCSWITDPRKSTDILGPVA